MADYNVNMKQWNGSSFDNVLPLAYNAKNAEALAGSSLSDIQQWVKNNSAQLYVGQYTGNGTYGANNPTSIICPFVPKVFVLPRRYASSLKEYEWAPILSLAGISSEYQAFLIYSGSSYIWFYVKWEAPILKWYSSNAAYQGSDSYTYSFALIGDNVSEDFFEQLITTNQTFTVPKTGKYYIELYGGGGACVIASTTKAYTGGSSCQSYTISLSEGDSFSVVVGASGGTSSAGGATSFGTYSVNGGGIGNRQTAGAGAGNLGKDGVLNSSTSRTINTNNGIYGSTYGVGGANSSVPATAGAVYLKYLGA